MPNRIEVSRRAVLGGIALAPLATLPFAAGAQGSAPPNILLVFPDQHRFDWLSGQDDIPVATPNIDRLAGRGVRFAKAYCSSPLCAPSRAGLLNGAEYDACGVDGNWADYPVEREGYFAKLRERGYHVAACGKLDLSKGSRTIGLDGREHLADWGLSDMVNCGGKLDAVAKWEAKKTPQEPYMAYLDAKDLAAIHAEDIGLRGFDPDDMTDYYAQTFPTPLEDEDYQDNWIGRTALTLMERFPAGAPWHLMVNFTGPHDPMDITRSMEGSARGRAFRPPVESTLLTPEVHTEIRENYAAMVENIDRWLGLFVAELERRGELDNTIIVFSSDHGEMLGDHDRWAKSYPYEPSVCVPLVIAGPGVAARPGSDALVSLIDLGATFCEYAGADRPDGMTAKSLRPLLEGATDTHRELAHSGLFGWRMVTDGRYKLIAGFDPAWAKNPNSRLDTAELPLILFDLDADPTELRDIAAEQPEIVARLQAALLPRNPDPDWGIPLKLRAAK